MNVSLITYTPDPERVIATAARICYSNKADIATISEGFTDEEIRKFIEQLIETGHHSTLEHPVFTFGIEGVSRILTHELVRHRIGIAISQRSQRYCAEGECDFVVPDSILKASEGCGDEISEVEDEFWASVCNDKQQYKDFMEVYDIPREDARYVLPGATMTRMIVTMNARELLHFFALRSCQRALPEMRQLANRMIRLVKPVAPILFKKAGPSCVQLGYCPEGSRCCGRAPTLKQLLDNWKKGE